MGFIKGVLRSTEGPGKLESQAWVADEAGWAPRITAENPQELCDEGPWDFQTPTPSDMVPIRMLQQFQLSSPTCWGPSAPLGHSDSIEGLIDGDIAVCTVLFYYSERKTK